MRELINRLGSPRPVFWLVVAVWDLLNATFLVLADASTWLVLLAVVCAVTSAWWSAEDRLRMTTTTKEQS